MSPKSNTTKIVTAADARNKPTTDTCQVQADLDSEQESARQQGARIMAFKCRPPSSWQAEYLSEEDQDSLFGHDNQHFLRIKPYVPDSVSRRDLRTAIDWLRELIPNTEPEPEPWQRKIMIPEYPKRTANGR